MKKLVYVTPRENVEITLPEEMFKVFVQMLNLKVATIKVTKPGDTRGRNLGVVVIDESN